MRNFTTLLISFILLVLIPPPLSGQSISISNISPPSPSKLQNNEDVTLHFSYSTKQHSGVRIFILPFTKGNPTPEYGTSGSRVYPRGHGNGSARFTIRKGIAAVDQIRFRVMSADQKRQVYEFFVPVQFNFSQRTPLDILERQHLKRDQKLAKILKYKRTEANNKPEDSSPTFLPDTSKVIKRIVKTDGTVQVHFSDGSITEISPSGKRYQIFVTSEGDTLVTTTLKIEVPGSAKPAAPPGGVFTASENGGEKWINGLNAWLEYFSSKLLLSIEAQLTDEKSMNNYINFEQNNSSTIYERVNLRYTFLEKLLSIGS